MVVYILDEKGVDLCNSGLTPEQEESTLPDAIVIVYNPTERGK